MTKLNSNPVAKVRTGPFSHFTVKSVIRIRLQNFNSIPSEAALYFMRTLRFFAVFTSIVWWFLSAHAGVPERFGGTNNFDLVAFPKTVTAWRTGGSSDLLKAFNKTGSGVSVSSNLVAQLTKILLNESTYMPPEWHSNCVLKPALVLTFSDGEKELDLFFCLDCDVMSVKTGAGKFVDSLFANGSTKDVVRVMKRIFPKDNAIQALQEK